MNSVTWRVNKFTTCIRPYDIADFLFKNINRPITFSYKFSETVKNGKPGVNSTLYLNFSDIWNVSQEDYCILFNKRVYYQIFVTF